MSLDEFEKVEDHEGYGMIRLGRVSSAHEDLFGSDIKHHSLIELTISEGEKQRGLNRDWYHSQGTIVQVYLSQAQWGEFVSSMGIGEGVPR
jgi:hypothetical protein